MMLYTEQCRQWCAGRKYFFHLFVIYLIIVRIINRLDCIIIQEEQMY